MEGVLVSGVRVCGGCSHSCFIRCCRSCVAPADYPLQKLLAATKTVDVELARGRDTLERLRARHAALLRRLLAVAGKVEALATRAVPEYPEERALREGLASLREVLTGSGDVLERVATLEEAQRMREEAAAGGGGGGRAAALSQQQQRPSLTDPDDVAGVLRQLDMQRRGVEQLVAVVSRDARDVGIVSDALEADAARAAGQGFRQRFLPGANGGAMGTRS